MSVARNFFRATGRVQVNLLDPETGSSTPGTYLGTKKILSIGASVDLDDTGARPRTSTSRVTCSPTCRSGPAVLTAQVNVAHWNGGTTPPVG